ncbi:hypothetical protein [uncultured Arcticibacterium sp.]|uniref:hypothetical protein n=1 Tax=uncultured Arcticibacterium sp. TaxID=2173042 RepID=UPI0030F63F86
MIYLIDDNKYEQMSKNYKIDYTSTLQSFSNHVTWLQTVPTKDIQIVIANASCILIHDSLDAKEDKERLVALAKSREIPFCVFSNGFTATVFEGESIREIKKDRFYNNLVILVERFVSTNKVNLRHLSLGQNYEVEKASIIQDRLINGTLLNYKENFNYEVAFPSGSIEYKDLIELVYLSDAADDFSDFEDKHNSKETTAQLMRSVITSMVKNVKSKYDE